jgi:hypothetical protein
VKSLMLFLIILQSARATSYFVTIAGLGGAPEYEAQFQRQAADLERAVKANGPDCHVETLTGPGATRQDINQLLTRIASSVKPEDGFALFLIGHGTFDDAEYKFNIPGPDMTAAEIANLLSHITAERQLVVNMTSASGGSLAALAQKNRVVITATKSGTEKNATVFARFWIEALQNSAADTDKNGTVSALEAFHYAQSRTTAYFQQEKLLATEHPMLDDTGAKDGVREPGPSNAQGLKAAQFILLRSGSDGAVANNPAKAKLIAKKEALESEIDRLKYQKAAMPSDEYKRQLSRLLLELAQTQAEIDQ